MLGWEKNPLTYGKATCVLLLDLGSQARSSLPVGLSPCSMLQVGPIPGRSLSRLPHRCIPRRPFMTPADIICGQITLRSVDYSAIWRHFLGSRVTHYCGAPTVQVRYLLQRPWKRHLIR